MVSGNIFVVPIKNATVTKDYSGSELQYNNTLKQWEIHKAIDFMAGEDLNVYAVADGTVSNVYTNYLEGTVVEISHKDGVVSVYKSLDSNVNVSIGDKVSAGSDIGKVSQSMAQEQNTGAHLHFEMLKNGIKVNPNDYLDLGNK
jgi:murein DD-endopeptidase MepM/ murein hydrolase activator NlpD